MGLRAPLDRLQGLRLEAGFSKVSRARQVSQRLTAEVKVVPGSLDLRGA